MIVWLRGSSDRAPPCRADVVDRHPDCDLAGCAQPRPGQMWCGLIHPAFPVQTGTIDHLGRGLRLRELDLGDGRTVPLTGILVPCLPAVGHCTARRLDDGATTSIGCGLGLAIDGGLPVVRLACADDCAARRRAPCRRGGHGSAFSSRRWSPLPIGARFCGTTYRGGRLGSLSSWKMRTRLCASSATSGGAEPSMVKRC